MPLMFPFLKFFFKSEAVSQMDVGGFEARLRHDTDTCLALATLAASLFIILTVSTRALWIILQRPMPWVAFRRLALLMSLLLSPSVLSSRHVRWALRPFLGDVCIFKIVTIVWNFLRDEERLVGSRSCTPFPSYSTVISSLSLAQRCCWTAFCWLYVIFINT